MDILDAVALARLARGELTPSAQAKIDALAVSIVALDGPPVYENICDRVLLVGQCSLEDRDEDWQKCKSSKPEESLPLKNWLT